MKIFTLFRCLTILSVLLPYKAGALEMDFRIGGTDIRDDDALWIQASGPITPDTPQKFRDFIGNKQNGSPKRIRFDSPGGNLAAGIELGYELRSRGFSTEVGRDEPHPDFPNESWQFTRRSPGECASACAYAFLGGVGRRVDVGSRLGFHQFYFTEEPTPQLQLSGSELSVQAQELAAILLSYIIAMGVDPSVLVFAGLTPQKEMFWLSAEDASMLGLTFEANAFRPWTVKMEGAGLVAESEREDRLFKMSALCTRQDGAYFELFVSDKVGSHYRRWLESQCVPQGSWTHGTGRHSVLGNIVDETDFEFVSMGGGYTVRVKLGKNPVIGSDPSFMWGDYSGSCTSERTKGTSVNLENALKLAFSNCVE